MSFYKKVINMEGTRHGYEPFTAGTHTGASGTVTSGKDLLGAS